jgi:hypothetical protein
MSNDECVRLYLRGQALRRKGKSYSYDGDVFYSYGHIIARRVAHDTYMIRRDGHSASTKRHVRKLMQEIPNNCQIVFDDWDGSALRDFEELHADMCIKLDYWMGIKDTAMRVPAVREADEEITLLERSLKALEDSEQEIKSYEAF